MPKRSNAFQKLIYQIQHTLAEGATVRESAPLIDRISGEPREVDIVIDAVVATHRLLVSIECVARGRKASVEWVEQMWAKHQTLPTNKLILVTGKGFYAPAAAKAEQLGIDAITFGTAESTDWAMIVGKLERVFLARFGSSAVRCVARIAGTFTDVAVGPDYVLHRPSGTPMGSLKDLEVTALHHPQYFPAAAKLLHTDGEVDLDLVVGLSDGGYLVAPDKGRLDIEGLTMTIRVRRKTAPVKLQQNVFGTAAVAHGKEDSLFGPSVITLIEQPNMATSGSMMILGTKTQAESIHRATGPPPEGMVSRHSGKQDGDTGK